MILDARIWRDYKLGYVQGSDLQRLPFTRCTENSRKPDSFPVLRSSLNIERMLGAKAALLRTMRWWPLGMRLLGGDAERRIQLIYDLVSRCRRPLQFCSQASGTA